MCAYNRDEGEVGGVCAHQRIKKIKTVSTILIFRRVLNNMVVMCLIYAGGLTRYTGIQEQDTSL